MSHGLVPSLLLAVVCSLAVAEDRARAEDASCVARPSEQPPLPSDPAAAALERGNRLWRAGELGPALDAYEASLKRAEAGARPSLAALAAANAAMIAVELRRPDAAGRLSAAAGRSAQLEDPRIRAELRIRIGRSQARLARETPNREARAQALLAAADSLALATTDARRAGDLGAESLAQGELGGLYEHRGRRDEAEQLTRRALHLALEARAAEQIYRWQWQLGRLARAEGKIDAALRSYRAAVATLTGLRSDAAALSIARSGTFQSQVEPLYTELVDLVLQRAAESDGDTLQALLAEARNVLENLKTAELRDYFDDSCLAQRSTTTESVPGALVLYPVPLPDRTELIVGRGGRLARYRADVDRETLLAEVQAFRSRLERLTTRQYLRHARQLYDWLIRPLEEELRDTPPDVLVVVPGGLLRTIPFAALHDGDAFLIERVPVALAPGLTLTDPRPIDAESVRVLAAGISQSIGGYPALASVEQELDAVGELFEGVAFRDAEFEVERFKSELRTRPFGIVHVASHAEFFANPEASFVLAWDGRISINQLAAIVASTQFREREPLELLTLSACETAAGDERAALGLAGVAVRSGARSALATLWMVHDEASAELVTAFYRELAHSGVSRAEALRRAQRVLLETRRFQHPSYWSPFLLINSWL